MFKNEMQADIVGKFIPTQQTTPEIRQASNGYDNAYNMLSLDGSRAFSRKGEEGLLYGSLLPTSCYGDEKRTDVLSSEYDKSRQDVIEIKEGKRLLLLGSTRDDESNYFRHEKEQPIDYSIKHQHLSTQLHIESKQGDDGHTRDNDEHSREIEERRNTETTIDISKVINLPCTCFNHETCRPYCGGTERHNGHKPWPDLLRHDQQQAANNGCPYAQRMFKSQNIPLHRHAEPDNNSPKETLSPRRTEVCGRYDSSIYVYPEADIIHQTPELCHDICTKTIDSPMKVNTQVVARNEIDVSCHQPVPLESRYMKYNRHHSPSRLTCVPHQSLSNISDHPFVTTKTNTNKSRDCSRHCHSQFKHQINVDTNHTVIENSPVLSPDTTPNPASGSEPQFLLQDPPKPKLKRQLPTLESTSVTEDISCEKGYLKRLKSRESIFIDPNLRSPHIRQSSVIKTPTKKVGNVFVFPEVANVTEKRTDYRFVVNDNHVPTTKDWDDGTFSAFGLQSPIRFDKRQMTDGTQCSPIKASKYLSYSLQHDSPPTAPRNCEQYYSRSPDKRRPLRSQSNIEESPNKRSDEEMAAIKYTRSISHPVHHNDRGYSRTPTINLNATNSSNINEDVGVNTTQNREKSQISSGVQYKISFDGESSPAAHSSLVSPRLQNEHDGFPSGRRNSFTSVRPCNKSTTQRDAGDIDVKIHCSGVARKCKDILDRLQYIDLNTNKNYDRDGVESAILQMARDAYKNIPKVWNTDKEMAEITKQLEETNQFVVDAMRTIVQMRELFAHGRCISRVSKGSVIIRIRCPTLTSLEDLWLKYSSGELHHLLYQLFVTPALLQKFDAKFIFLKVSVSKADYRRCQEELGAHLRLQRSLSKQGVKELKKNLPEKRILKKVDDHMIPPLSPKFVYKNSNNSSPLPVYSSPQNSPNVTGSPKSYHRREIQFSFSSYGDQSPRRVFQEINTPSPRSPSRKFNLDEISQFIDDSEDDQENVSNSIPSPCSKAVASPLSPSVSSPKYSPRYSPR